MRAKTWLLGIALTAVIVVAIVVVVIFTVLRQGVTLSIHEERIVAQANAMFPMEKTYFRILRINYSDPVIEFMDDRNRVRIGLSAAPSLAGDDQRFRGSAVVHGGFRYDPTVGEVYLTDFIVESLNLGNTRGISLERISAALSSSLEEVYAQHPVYRLDDRSHVQATAKMLVKEIEISDKQVHIHLGLP